MMRFRTYEMRAAVFLTGAAVLVIEVAATRVLSPHFGNTIFAFSSVISTILAALSVGYYAGGRYADRGADARSFYRILLAGGAAALLMTGLASIALPLLARLPMTWGPLVSSLVLFFAPALLLGALSPMAVKLEADRSSSGIGSASGNIFFWSTAGSIVGSLMTGFVLVPRFDLVGLFVGVSVLLLAMGIGGLALHGGLKRSAAVKALIGIVAVGWIANVAASSERDLFVFLHNGVYERIAVEDRVWNGRPARFLFQDATASAAVYLDGDDLAFDYTKSYELYRVFKPDLREALFLGGGGYTMPAALLRENQSVNIEVTEIEPSLYDIAKRYFRAPDDPRLQNIVADARRHLRESEKSYDLIYGDAYNTVYSVPAHLTTLEFFELVRSKLVPGGIFMMNVIGSYEGDGPSFLLSEIRTLKAAFPTVFVFKDPGSSLGEPQNFILVAVNGESGIGKDDLRIGGAARLSLDYGELVVEADEGVLASHRLMRDTYAPVDYYNIGLFRKAAEQKKAAPAGERAFDGERALDDIRRQLEFGSRSIRSATRMAYLDFVSSEFERSGLSVVRQTWEHRSKDGGADILTNVIARLNPEAQRRIIVGTHYDTRAYPDRDPLRPTGLFLGANDGASGVAVALELARSLSERPLEGLGVDFVLFDGEEGEHGSPESEWKMLGSEYFAANLSLLYAAKPEGGIVVDMVCDADLRIYKDGTSLRHAPRQTEAFWDIANGMHPDVFPDEHKYDMLDDHVALNGAGIPSFLLIDFDYPPFHTTADTLDKCSAASLGKVGGALEAYMRGLN